MNNDQPTPPAPRVYTSNPLELIKPSLEAFKLIWAQLLLLVIVMTGATIAAAIVFTVMFLVGPIGQLLAFLVALPVILFISGYAGWASTKLIIAAANGQKLSLAAALPTKVSDAWKLIWTSLISGIVIALGLVFFVVPGIIFISWFGLAVYIVVNEGASGIDALKRSRELARGRAWDVLGAVSLAVATSALAIIPFLGPLLYFVLSLILIPAVAVRYISLVQLKQQPGWETIPVSPLNYVVLIVAIFASSISLSAQSNKTMEQLQNQTMLENTAKPY